MKRFLSIVLVGVGLLALAGLGFAYLVRPDAASTAAASPDDVTIWEYSFRPATLRVAVGTTVTWTNRDGVAHTVTGRSGDWGSGLLAQGQQFSYTFTQPGTYEYFCEPHPWMQARIVVGEATGEPAPDETTPTPPTNPEARREQMRQMMDSMHGPGSFDQMRQWMEERWGPGAFDAMLQNCPHGAGNGPAGQGMMDGGGMMDGQGIMGGGMMGGPQR
ncbi:MAG: cupredoxin family copper-binding protein [Chloroflexota bacterium]|nr:cupredoxin family copper-binding protein [Chloroflexota bacterium]